MRTIILWWQKLVETDSPNVGARFMLGVLGIFSWIHQIALWNRRRRGPPQRVDAVILSVGNLNVGGTGKTPLVRTLVRLVSKKGFRVAVVCRAYRSRVGRMAKVPPRPASPQVYGDEPTLLASWFPDIPVFVGSDRALCARRAADQGAQVIILDDGFQSRWGLHRDLDIIITRARKPFGNRKIFPAGPLRERPSAIRESPVVVLVCSGNDRIDADAETQIRRLHPAVTLIHANLEAAGLWDLRTDKKRRGNPVAGASVLAFCGIGYPQGFTEILHKMGAARVHLVSYEDHHIYKTEELEELIAEGGRKGCDFMVTTEKDAVKIRQLLSHGGSAPGFLSDAMPIGVVRTSIKLNQDLSQILEPVLALSPGRTRGRTS